MNESQPEKRHSSTWGAATDKDIRRVMRPAPRSVSASGKPGFVDMCPICVFLLDSEDGQILFERYMRADVHVDGQTITAVGWHCEMCGASGAGQIPGFHEKPEK